MAVAEKEKSNVGVLLIKVIGVAVVVLVIVGGIFLYHDFVSPASANVAVKSAFGDEFEAVQTAALEHAPDAVLIGVETRRPVGEGDLFSWVYWFVSRQNVSSFTITTGDDGLRAELQGRVCYTQEVLDSAIGAQAVVYDADEAFCLLKETMSRDERYSTLGMSLVLCDATKKADSFGNSTSAWRFSFNENGESSTSVASGGAESEAASLPAPSAGSLPFSYEVDVMTGKVRKVA